MTRWSLISTIITRSWHHFNVTIIVTSPTWIHPITNYNHHHYHRYHQHHHHHHKLQSSSSSSLPPSPSLSPTPSSCNSIIPSKPSYHFQSKMIHWQTRFLNAGVRSHIIRTILFFTIHLIHYNPCEPTCVVAIEEEEEGVHDEEAHDSVVLGHSAPCRAEFRSDELRGSIKIIVTTTVE